MLDAGLVRGAIIAHQYIALPDTNECIGCCKAVTEAMQLR